MLKVIKLVVFNHGVPVVIVIYSDPSFSVGFRGMIMCCAKLHCADFLWEAWTYMNKDAYTVFLRHVPGCSNR
jgi:hypothetical protein